MYFEYHTISVKFFYQLLPWTACIYNSQIRQNVNIHEILMNVDREHLIIKKFDDSNDDLTYVINFEPGYENNFEPLEYCLHFNNTHKLFLMGKTDGRELIENLLEEIFGNDDYDVITPITLTPSFMINDIFENIIKDYSDFNRIHKLTCFFERDISNGYTYNRNTYARLDYILYGNCGSAHSEFQRFIENSSELKIRFHLFRVPGLIDGKDPIKIDLNHKMSFRIFTERSFNSWLEFLSLFEDFQTL